MVDRIATKILGVERSLERKADKPTDSDSNLTGTPKIRVVSTFGSDSDLVKSCEKFDKVLSRTRSLSLSGPYVSPTPSPAQSRVNSPRNRSHSLSGPFVSPTPSPIQTRANSPTPVPTNESRRPNKMFSHTKKTGVSIRSRLVRTKELALSKRFGKKVQCKHQNCMCCTMISSKNRYRYNKTLVRTAEGSCASYDIVYLVICDICHQHYIG